MKERTFTCWLCGQKKFVPTQIVPDPLGVWLCYKGNDDDCTTAYNNVRQEAAEKERDRRHEIVRQHRGGS